MNDELTKVDLEKMQQEIDYRITVLRPQLIEEVQQARAFGDLSENFEYKEAKRQKNRNESRIRYLRQMIRTANVVEVDSAADEVGLFDTVGLYLPASDTEMTVRMVTTLRVDPFNNLISRESPLGGAIFGRRVGDEVTVQVNPEFSYPVRIVSIQKGEDDASLEIAKY